jgi:hypothetical protein
VNLHWRDAHRSYQTPLAVRRLGNVSITMIWLGLAVLCFALILAVTLWA